MDTYGHRGGCVNHVFSPRLGGLLSGLRPAGGRLTQQSDRQHIGVVKVSTVLVNVTPELVEEPVPIGSTHDDCDTE